MREIIENCALYKQGCHYDFKLAGKYNKYVGKQTARDLFWFYFSSIFQ